MELRHLTTFRTVLREGSFLRAARALRLAQPTVTLHIQELEEELGLALFDRTGRRRPLTAAGTLFGERAPDMDTVLAGSAWRSFAIWQERLDRIGNQASRQRARDTASTAAARAP
jgi:molybdenum-dependent DNA-binding transcriptional regulator ModE